ncbi:FliM/FliN family flagellar motor switch protein [Pandoraea sputorum]|uniref:FliM/FliN family flagellar motor switch protein n=1 Tax=Pandoraea sputorum TaxID=93222 RepID=UPI0012573E9D|nr:FliM/FliN family flagellar motor switch protein [Pandoraea sputorum]VVE55427.1 hypothetical protein PSP20601_04986 [Pandoraea sputorum]
MSAERPSAAVGAFELSRIGATAHLDGCVLVADRAQAGGPGLTLSTRCGGELLCFWVPEREWCDWIAPQLPVHALAQIPSELLPLLAGWTLAPLDGWLQQQDLGALSQPEASTGEAPGHGWRLTLEDGARRLPLFVQHAPAALFQALLATLTPSPEQEHDLPLALGWCLLAPAALHGLEVGDALPIIGMADTLDVLWLHPDASPGQLNLHDAHCAVVVDAPTPPADDLPGTLRLAVEVGRARLAAGALASWVPGVELHIDARAHAALRLTAGERVWAQGQLLRLDDGWAMRIDARAA